MARQLALDLTIPPALTRDDFLATPANRDALAMLDAPELWPGGRLLLVGGPGAGKSHLARFWAEENGAEIRRAATIAPGDVDRLARPGGALAIEAAHEIAGLAEAEDALFHLWNLAGARGMLLLVTARGRPRDWGIALPDLLSRLEAALAVVLGPPDDALLPGVLVKLFADRQIQVDPGLIGWLATRMERDLGLARHLVAAIDRRSLADRRPVGRRLAAELLDDLAAAEARRHPAPPSSGACPPGPDPGPDPGRDPGPRPGPGPAGAGRAGQPSAPGPGPGRGAGRAGARPGPPAVPSARGRGPDPAPEHDPNPVPDPQRVTRKP